MTTIWATIIILGVLIAIHEFGHFIAARSVGVRVERFSIGIPPRIFTIDSIDNGFLFNIFFFHRSLKNRRIVHEQNLVVKVKLFFLVILYQQFLQQQLLFLIAVLFQPVL